MTTTFEKYGRPLPVVVGVDGSRCARAALDWAGRYARAVGAPLVVVVAWHLPSSYGWAPPLPGSGDLEPEARTAAEVELDEVLGVDARGEVTISVVQGHPARALVDASAHAGLVVVGSRGHGQFAGMLIGSVSEYLTAHAHCPVVVVRGDEQVRGAPAA